MSVDRVTIEPGRIYVRMLRAEGAMFVGMATVMGRTAEGMEAGIQIGREIRSEVGTEAGMEMGRDIDREGIEKGTESGTETEGMETERGRESEGGDYWWEGCWD